jgi:tetratricopeptide (TPR) repeat protein
MQRLSATHFGIAGIIIALITCTVLLGFVSTTPSESNRKTAVIEKHSDGKSLEQLIAESRSKFNPEMQKQISLIEATIDTDRDFVKRGRMYDSLARIAGRAGQPVFAAWATEQKAIKNNGSGSDWQIAGERYRSAVSFMQDETSNPVLFEAAVRCFQKALELEPKNAEAKVGLGICMVQSSADPMQGISMLLEVVKEDSTNINAQLALGDFSVQRGAPDKAVLRYSTALKLRPDYYGLHLSIAEQFQTLGQFDSAISHLQAYVQIETDPLLKNDVENAIRKLQVQKTQQTLVK